MFIWIFWVFLFFLGIVFFDFSRRKVPNSLLLAAFAIQLFWLCFMTQPEQSDFVFVKLDGWLSLIGLVQAFILLPLWAKRLMGAGDIKFIAVLGFILGWKVAIWIVLMAGLLAGPHAAVQMMQVRRDGPSRTTTRRGVPYAGYIALTAIIWLIWKLLE
ncbi:prepilin peptidase [Kerstersia gyiorum]|uniref:prepilin peptidase n=1 Tax=Kerstersia gyiorum TaxID=206506 RepID=UPI00209C735D|nr:prepilin peptidase [Kerstersia gyiorum]MCP1632833.1 prepilin peptidase CpaA [Kerstersia gyiorum]MCP1635636.1 prepilin peptidase CpaA [Kerstersia gyiorum]MCP1670957.1 prepilin peptidase CpaA [Kerstersia gyiorum]MCP1678388.1 prepilin peptidase CpaA [Kerstersia gyiorum]MCP1682186.1 prepilin peptidase CpaA [Kerstersia gyiorum]